MKQPDLRWTLQRVKHELLPQLDPNAAAWDRARWLKLGMILHHQGEGDDEWLELWDHWSAQDERVKDDGEPMYKPGLCEKEWESFGRTTNVATIGTLVMWVIRHTVIMTLYWFWLNGASVIASSSSFAMRV
ncbi:PriCT-2 domain-containing protein [Paraburkholderia sp. EG304]|uniref:PriCT-2 domain-containing protein n=1 Tax=Paraburkholderia sp. EG304 TaxID=3237015 RepID=UPI00397BCBCA